MKGNKMKKIVALLLAAVMLSVALVSCSDKPIELPKPENGETVMTINGEKILYDYVRYVYLNTKADMEYGNENIFETDPDAFAALKESTLDTIATNCAISKLAKQYKISLTEKEKKEVNDLIKELKKDKELWEDAVKEGFITEYTVAYLERFAIVWGKIYEYITNVENGVIKYDDESLLADIKKNFRNIRYVYISYNESNKEEKKALAESVYAKAMAGENFASLIKEYGEDPYIAALADIGSYYTAGAKLEIVEDAVELIGEGEITPIIDVSEGYFIIQRLGIDIEYAEENLNTLADYYVARRFNEMVEEVKNSLKIETGDFWNNLKLDDIK